MLDKGHISLISNSLLFPILTGNDPAFSPQSLCCHFRCFSHTKANMSVVQHQGPFGSCRKKPPRDDHVTEYSADLICNPRDKHDPYRSYSPLLSYLYAGGSMPCLRTSKGMDEAVRRLRMPRIYCILVASHGSH